MKDIFIESVNRYNGLDDTRKDAIVSLYRTLFEADESKEKKEEPKDQGYLSGLAGKITGKDGQSFSMDKLKGDIKEKACDFVLDNASSLL